ncbi:MAG: hypothetical protein ACLVHV_01615 [Oscillospiraceae bacterium]
METVLRRVGKGRERIQVGDVVVDELHAGDQGESPVSLTKKRVRPAPLLFVRNQNLSRCFARRFMSRVWEAEVTPETAARWTCVWQRLREEEAGAWPFCHRLTAVYKTMGYRLEVRRVKLSWKIVLVVLLIVAVTVSAASYTMIASAFQAELDSQVSAAADESQMLCLTLGALAAQAVGNGEGSLREILNSSFFQNYRMIVYRQDGSVLWQNREEAAGLAPGDVGEEGICYMISRLERGGSRYLETIQRLELKQETF